MTWPSKPKVKCRAKPTGPAGRQNELFSEEPATIPSKGSEAIAMWDRMCTCLLDLRMASAWLTILASCSSAGSSRRPPSCLSDVPTPYPRVRISSQICHGEQVVLSYGKYCANTDISDDVWKSVLESEGYVVQLSNVLIGHPGRQIYGLRFRKIGLFGDLVSWPLENDGCRRYVVRLQQGNPDQPLPWKSEYALTPISRWERLPERDLRLRVFPADPSFPPNYP